jgi:hypothetical protein
MFFFGRNLCPDRKRCSVHSPTVSYTAVRSTSECLDTAVTTDYFPDAFTYYSAMAKIFDNTDYDPVTYTVTSTNTAMIQNLHATSDVVVARSSALMRAGNDVPVYLITRNPAGNITTGRYLKSGNVGAPFFTFNANGAFTN